MKKIALNKETVRKLTNNDLRGAKGGYVEPCEAPYTKPDTFSVGCTVTCACTDTCVCQISEHACGNTKRC